MTREQFIDKIKLLYDVKVSDDVLGIMLENALSEYSVFSPVIKKVENVKNGYELPFDCLRVIRVCDYFTNEEVDFEVKSGKLYLGVKKIPSYVGVRDIFYDNPYVHTSDISIIPESVNVYYAVMQTVETIDDYSALMAHMEYQIYLSKANEAMKTENIPLYPSSISDGDGNVNQTITFTSAGDVAKHYSELSKRAYEKFRSMMQKPYYVRG